MVFKISDYSEELLGSLDTLPKWPEKVKAMQKNWIGKSEGASITFYLENSPDLDKLEVFTTRPDTILECRFVRYLLTIRWLMPLQRIARKLSFL